MADLTGMRRDPPRVLGSLLSGDVSGIANGIVAATAFHEVTAWVSTDAEVLCMQTDAAPDLPAEYLLGTYRMGARCADVEEDLRALRRARVSDAILF